MFNARTIGLGVTLIVIAGCAAMQPTLDVSSSAERSYDGLYPISNTIVAQAWARADVDLSGYKKIKVESAGIQYRPTKASAGRTTSFRGRETDFPISPKNRARLAETVSEAFQNEFARLERFEITNVAGPDVLIVRGALLDVVSHVPQDLPGRSDVYLESIGEATLVVELIDSQSESVLVRAVDRRAAKRLGMQMPSNSVSNWTEVTRLARTWARLLRQRLDELSEQMILSEDAA